MKVFLLAAGKGSRISKKIPDIPKSTLPIQGKPLIQRTVEMLIKRGLEVYVIAGYRAEHMEKVLKPYPVTILYNPFYDVTNSIASLWFAEKYMTDDECIIANADVYWSEEMLNFILQQKREVFMLSDVTRKKDGDYFFQINHNQEIVKYGKELCLEERSAEYVGIAYLNRSMVQEFKIRLLSMIHHQNHGVWWENVLYSMIPDKPIYAVDVEGRFWAEIDFIEDYQRIIQYVESIE